MVKGFEKLVLFFQGLYNKVKSIGTPLEYPPPEVSYLSPDSYGSFQCLGLFESLVMSAEPLMSFFDNFDA